MVERGGGGPRPPITADNKPSTKQVLIDAVSLKLQLA